MPWFHFPFCDNRNTMETKIYPVGDKRQFQRFTGREITQKEQTPIFDRQRKGKVRTKYQY